MKVLFIASFASDKRYCIQDADGKLWLMNAKGKLIKPEFKTEADGREMFAHLCWNVQTAPQE